MPISRHARWMRNAISPRLAMRIFLNMTAPISRCGRRRVRCGCPGAPWRRPGGCDPRPCVSPCCAGSFDDEERLPELDRLAVLAEDLLHRAGLVGLDLVHDLHGLDDADRVALLDHGADLREGR